MNFKSALIAAPILVSLGAAAPPAAKRVDIHTALRQKLISVNAEGKGMNSENCVDLNIKNLSSAPVEIVVPTGTLFDTVNEGEQNILTTQPTVLALQPGGSATGEAYGFCCQSTNSVPSVGSVFKVKSCTDTSLVKMADYLSAHTYDPGMQQSAIWSVSDGHSLGAIYNNDRKQTEELRTFTASLTGREVPFYNVDYGYTANHEFVRTVKVLQGTMNIRVLRAGKASLCMYGPDGHIVQCFYVDRPLDAGDYAQRFKYASTELAAGIYKVRLTVNGQLASERIIEI